MVTKITTKGDGVTIRLGKVVSCEFESEWLNPHSKKIVYYHDVVTDMGDILNIGTMDKNSNRIKKGAFIEYTINEKGKTSLISSSNDKAKIAEQAVLDKEEKAKKLSSVFDKNRIKGQEAFLGYAWSYAKDLIIAGKTMNDVNELKNIAKFIYDEIGKQLSNE